MYSSTLSGDNSYLGYVVVYIIERQFLPWVCSMFISGRQFLLWVYSSTFAGDNSYLGYVAVHQLELFVDQDVFEEYFVIGKSVITVECTPGPE